MQHPRERNHFVEPPDPHHFIYCCRLRILWSLVVPQKPHPLRGVFPVPTALWGVTVLVFPVLRGSFFVSSADMSRQALWHADGQGLL
jgi:hypothetical protein